MWVPGCFAAQRLRTPTSPPGKSQARRRRAYVVEVAASSSAEPSVGVARVPLDGRMTSLTFNFRVVDEGDDIEPEEGIATQLLPRSYPPDPLRSPFLI